MGEYENFRNVIVNYFIPKKWRVFKCRDCQREFLAKEKTATCGCMMSSSADLVSRKKKMNIADIKEKMDTFFSELDYVTSCFPSVKNDGKDTAFVVAAVQQFNCVLKNNYLFNDNKIYSPQVCVRLRDLDGCGIKDGFLHSFVNTSTLKLNANFEMYCEYIDDWIELLSHLGVHATRLKIVISNTPVKIIDVYYGWNVDIMIGGLELGHCSYFNRVVSQKAGNVTGIDCGFCLERICWAVNGDKFFEYLIPKDIRCVSEAYDEKFQELMRTVVLIIMSGINVGRRDDSFQLKKLIYKLSLMTENFAIVDGCINHYYYFWDSFVSNSIPLGECKRILYGELRKAYISNGVQKKGLMGIEL